MAKQTVNNGDTFGVARGKINSNFTEVYNDLATKATGTGTANGTNTGDQDLSGKADVGHTHTGVYSPVAHTHAGVYEPANSNIQTHIGSPHAAVPTVCTLANDQATGANTTPVTLTGLSFSYAVNSVYRIWFMGRVSPAAATTGCGFQFDLSDATGVTISVQFFHQLASTGTQSGGHSIADDASVGVSSGLPGTGNYPVTGFGLLVSTTNSGTAQLRFRSETTAVITARAGLTLVVEKIV